MAIMSNSIQNNTGNSSTSVPSSRTRTFRSGSGTIRLQEGQILKGVVSDVHGNEITLSMEDGSSFTGKLPDANQYSIGQKAAFLITNLEQNTIYMKATGSAYLLDMEDTIEQALEEANLPKSQRNMEVVRSLLQNQQSISRESILSSIRDCARFPKADVNAVITMHRLNMPMTQASVEQFENYQNQTHQLLQQMDSLENSIGDMLHGIGTQVPRLAKEVGTQLLSLALEGQPSLEENNLVLKQETLSSDLSESAASESTVPESTESETAAPETAMSENSQVAAEAGPFAKMKQMLTNLAENATGKAGGQAQTADAGQPFIHEQAGFILSPEEREAFSTLLKDYPIPEEVRQGIADGNITAREFLNTVLQAFPEMTEEQAAKLIVTKPFQAMVKGQFTSNWTISPEQLKEENGLDEIYGKMSKQFEALSKFNEQVLGKDVFTEMTKQAQSMNDNLDFMKLLNENFQYIQLPLKLQEQNAHGDLYVMTRKESLKKNPNHLKVLLHLDMEHLGTLDIQLAKENTAVSAKFFVEEKSVMRLLERNINLLSDALNKQGYAFSSELSLKEKQMDIVKDFISADAPVGDVKRYNFDLRA